MNVPFFIQNGKFTLLFSRIYILSETTNRKGILYYRILYSKPLDMSVDNFDVIFALIVIVSPLYEQIVRTIMNTVEMEMDGLPLGVAISIHMFCKIVHYSVVFVVCL